jgi:hypothetical protein
MLARLLRRTPEPLQRAEEAPPNPAVALAVGLVYLLRTAAGARLVHELEMAVRKYAADPVALWKLVQSDAEADRDEPLRAVIDTTAETIERAPPRRR